MALQAREMAKPRAAVLKTAMTTGKKPEVEAVAKKRVAKKRLTEVATEQGMAQVVSSA
jgi:hypothetical protein